MCNEEKQTASGSIHISTKPISSHILQARVLVPGQIIKEIYKRAVTIYTKHAQPEGLKNMTLPQDYVEQEHTDEINNNVKKFILKHIVIDFLLNQVSNKKIAIANYPRLKKMNFLNNGSIEYIFDLSVATSVPLKDWKLFTFKAPKRKRYKDLDKQVDFFIKRECEKHKKLDKLVIENSDWVNFEAIVVDDNQKPIIPLHKANFWMKINITHIEKPFHMHFIGKQENDSFVSYSMPVNEEFQDSLTENCNFLISIKSIAKGSHLSIEALKTIFKLKNKVDIHNKLIEVFSYRNDISQRRSIVEEVFHLFFSKHRFEVPKHLTIRKQESLIDMLRKQPDYQVYKAQKDFHEKVAMLAEKLLKEEILIDQIAYKENIKVASRDIKHYLTLFNNNRLREFVYFKPAFEPLEDTDRPLPESYLKQAVLREKTLNHIIHSLTR
jgi:FKBP-type peptidyl-prolyl cis-trans isomerase (trigger factor)